VYNHPATTELYTLSLHDALPIFPTGIRSSIAGTGEITRCKGANIPRPSSHRGCRPSGRHRPDHRAPGIGRFARISCLRSEFDEGEAGPVGCALAGAAAVPDIGADVVMIAAGRQEDGRVAVVHHRVHADRFVPPALGLVDVAYAQMHVADHAAGWRALPAGIALAQLAEQASEVERHGCHL